MVDYSEAIGLEGFEDVEGYELTAKEASGVIAISGVVMFDPNLERPGGAPGNPPKYGIDILVPKDSDDAVRLFAVAKHVAAKAWGVDSEKEFEVASQIASGITGRSLSFNVKDGDIVDPEFNAGFWVVGARNGDPVLVLDPKGRVISNPDNYPGRNWGVRAFIEVWAQSSRERVNTRLLGVQAIAPGVRRVGRTQEQTQALVQGILAEVGALPSPEALQIGARATISEPEPEPQPAPRSARTGRPAGRTTAEGAGLFRGRAPARAQDEEIVEGEEAIEADVVESTPPRGVRRARRAPRVLN